VRCVSVFSVLVSFVKAVEARYDELRCGQSGRGHGKAVVVWRGLVRCDQSGYGGQLNSYIRRKEMAGFPKKERQRIIDEYLAASGNNMFVPHEFVDWLGGQPGHEAYDWFYGMDDAQAARQHRIQLARQMASGLRIVVQDTTTNDQVVSLSVREYPTFISPVSLRKSGGGYERFDPDSSDAQQELRRQAATAMASWLSRYRGCAENIGLDMGPLEDIAQTLRGVEEEVA